MKASRKFIELFRSVFVVSLVTQTTAFIMVMGIFGSSANAQDTLLEEIIVVGTKVQDGVNVQEAPYSITTLTGGYLEEAGIKDVFDMQQNVPGLIVGRSQSQTTSNFSIRGIGTSSNNFGLESSVGLYVDGVYRSRQNSMINELVDIAAVEVFRGPQGTLFGKNTPQGAIQMLTTRPDPDDPNAFVELTAGNYGLVKLSAASSFALSDNTAMRATLFSSQRDGYVSDLNLGSEIYNDRDRFGVRLQLYSTPSDNLDVRIIADYSEIDEVCCVGISRVDGLYSRASLTNPLGPTPGPDAVLAGLGGTIFTNFPYPDPFLAPFPTVITGVGFEDYLVAYDFPPRSTSEDGGLSLELNYDLNNGMTLTSVTGYRTFDTFSFIDADFTNVSVLERTQSAQQSSITQELRVAKNYGNGVNFVAGAYYFSQDLDNQKDTSGGPFLSPYLDLAVRVEGAPLIPTATTFVNLAALIDANNFPPFPPIGDGTIQPAGTAFPSTLLGDPANPFAIDSMVQEHESWAVFGQVDIPLGDKWLVTLGARYTEEDKDMTGTFVQGALGPPINIDGLVLVGCQLGNALGFPSPDFDPLASTCSDLRDLEQAGAPFPTSPSAPFNPNDPVAEAILAPFASEGWGTYLFPPLAPRPDLAVSLKDDQVTGTAKITWLPSDSVLVYLSWGTGYKSGGTNTDRIDAAFNPVFQAETSESIELGFKADFPDQNIRLNVSVYDTQVDDLQANSFTGTGFNVQNAGIADTFGGEIEFWWYPSDTFTIQAFYARSEADYDNFEKGTCWAATPFHTQLDDPGQLPPDPLAAPSVLPNVVCSRTGGRLAYNPENRFFLGLTKEFQLTGTATAFVRGEYNYASDLFTDGTLEPLTLQDAIDLFNLRLGLRWGSNEGSELVLWGRNLGDERYFAGSFDQPIGDGRVNSYPAEPRTYGITFRQYF
jgi:outer membrane receptor protein involved in Fe transport